MYFSAMNASARDRLNYPSRLLLVLLICCIGIVSQAALLFHPTKVSAKSSADFNISGIVFDDLNQNGVLDRGEPGVNGVVVTMYNALNVQVATQTTGTVNGSTGHYSVDFSGVNGGIRVEFSNFGPSSTLPALKGYQASKHTGGTTVAFVDGTQSANIVDLGIERPEEYCQNNPQLVTSCYVIGDQSSPSSHVMVSFAYNNNGTSPSPKAIANAPDVGATWGLAYRRSSDSLFAASYVKRHSGLKPGGSTGAIYLIEKASSASSKVDSSPFVDLNAIFGANTAGSNPHDTRNYDLDARAYDAIGKIGLGGMALSEDETTLHVMNLANRELYNIPLGAPPAQPHLGPITHTPVPVPGDCAHDDFRPFAVSSYHEDIYVGAVCTAESTIASHNGLGDTTQLKGYVFLYTPGSGFTNTPVFTFPLNYTRRCGNGASASNCLSTYPAFWRPWHPTFMETNPNSGAPVYPQPMLTSIAFDHGDMILGLRDRYGDQTGFKNLTPDGKRRVNGVTAGDTLRACQNTSGDISQGWTLENNATCGGIKTGGFNNTQGPGNGEYYFQDQFMPYHHEVSMGGVLQIPGVPTMATTAFDPVSSINSGGIRTFNNTSGTKTTAYQVFNSSVKGTFAKANGLGALVALCQSAPVEIGNRVWLDKNGNGIQDSDEPGMAGVYLTLYGSNGKFVSSTKTDANGHYYFTINPRQNYLIKLDHQYDFTHGQLLGLQLTQADQDTTNHTADSKAVLLHPSNPIDKGNFPQIVIGSHEPGQNDDLQGIGFKEFVPPPHFVAGLVYNDYNQSGSHDTREPGVNGVVATAYDSTGTQVATSTTGSVRGIQGWYEMQISPSVNAVRVQFTNFGGSSSHPQLVGFQPGTHAGGTTVAFVNNTANGALVNLGIARPGEFCQNNPLVATNCYVFGNQSKTQDHVVVRFPYDSAGNTPPPTPLANAPDVGTTWGLAYRRATDTLYVASYMKRHAGFRPGGSTGAIYEIHGATTPNPQPINAPFVDLNQVFGNNTAGANPHTLNNYDLDAKAYDSTGKVSLGGMAMSEDDNTLYVVNLADRKLYGIPLGAVPALSHSSQHAHIPHSTSTPAISRLAIPRPGDCVDKDFRPFSVTAYNNGIYVGAICSAESTITKKNPNGDINKMHAYVLLYTPGQKFAAKPAFEFGLNYPRGCANGVEVTNCKRLFAATWHPWHPTFSWNAPNAFPAFPEPMLTSITFDNGDMVLGLRDRYGDQVGWNNPAPGGGARLSAITAGDLLRACLRTPGDIASGWNLENNGMCGDTTTNGKSNGQGPGVGEYYYQDNFLPFHDEVSLGGAYQVPGFSTVMTTNFNPTDRIDSGGTRAFDNLDGTKQWGYMVYSNSTPNTFGKADGLGSVIAMCQSAPIEIGNRVWLDSNSNGIQDAGESGIAGLTVNLYAADGTTLVHSTTTDANGEYYFTIAPRTSYIIKMDNAADYTGRLASHDLTTADQDTHTHETDSKAHLPNPASPIGSGNYPQITVGAHAPGYNDHTFDIGFTGPPVPSIQHGAHHPHSPGRTPALRSHPSAFYDDRRWKHQL